MVYDFYYLNSGFNMLDCVNKVLSGKILLFGFSGCGDLIMKIFMVWKFVMGYFCFDVCVSGDWF